jgi:hypothetical protein
MLMHAPQDLARKPSVEEAEAIARSDAAGELRTVLVRGVQVDSYRLCPAHAEQFGAGPSHYAWKERP